MSKITKKIIRIKTRQASSRKRGPSLVILNQKKLDPRLHEDASFFPQT